MNWKRITLWSGVAFVWLITFGCWFLSAMPGRQYDDWARMWATWPWLGIDLLLGSSAFLITACAALIEELSK